jgi:hypothetical protein
LDFDKLGQQRELSRTLGKSGAGGVGVLICQSSTERKQGYFSIEKHFA